MRRGLAGQAGRDTPIEDKESYRWVTMLRQAQEEALRNPATRLICLADSEADIYEVMVEGMREPGTIDWIIRACQNRALLLENGQKHAEHYVRDAVLSRPALFKRTIQVRGRKAKVACETRGRRQPRKSRKAVVAVRAMRLTLRPPFRPGHRLPAIAMNVVVGQRGEPAAERRAGGMAAADELAD